MDIPYTIEARKDTGLTNGKLGIWLFLASEVMFFGSLFTSYLLLRLSAPEWPPAGELVNVPLGLSGTAVLILSGLTLHLSRRRAAGENFHGCRSFLVLTILLGILFLALKGLEAVRDIGAGHIPSESTFFALYFTMTGLHVLHVLAGIVVAAALAVRGDAGGHAVLRHRVEILSWYWQFVNIVWLCTIVSLYLV